MAFSLSALTQVPYEPQIKFTISNSVRAKYYIGRLITGETIPTYESAHIYYETGTGTVVKIYEMDIREGAKYAIKAVKVNTFGVAIAGEAAIQTNILTYTEYQRPMIVTITQTENTMKFKGTVSVNGSITNATGTWWIGTNYATELKSPIVPAITVPTVYRPRYKGTNQVFSAIDALGDLEMKPLIRFTGATSFNTLIFTISCNAYEGTDGVFVSNGSASPPSPLPNVARIANSGFKVTMTNRVSSGTYYFKVGSSMFNPVCHNTLTISYTKPAVPPPPVPTFTSITQNTNSLNYTAVSTGSTYWYGTNKETQLTNPMPNISVPTTYTVYVKGSGTTGVFSTTSKVFTVYPTHSLGTNITPTTKTFFISCTNAYPTAIASFIENYQTGVPPSNISITRRSNSSGYDIIMPNGTPSGRYTFQVKSPTPKCSYETIISYTGDPPPVLNSVTQTMNSLAFTSDPANVTLYQNGSEFTSPLSSITIPTDYVLTYKNSAGVSSNSVTLKAYPLYNTLLTQGSYNTRKFKIVCNAYTGTTGAFTTLSSSVDVGVELRSDKTGFDIDMKTVNSGSYSFKVEYPGSNPLWTKSQAVTYTKPTPPLLSNVSQTSNTLAFTSNPASVTLVVNTVALSTLVSTISVPTQYGVTYINADGDTSSTVNLTVYPLYTFTGSFVFNTLTFFIACNAYTGTTGAFTGTSPTSQIVRDPDRGFTITMDTGVITGSYMFRIDSPGSVCFKSQSISYTQPVTSTLKTAVQTVNTNTLLCTPDTFSGGTYSQGTYRIFTNATATGNPSVTNTNNSFTLTPVNVTTQYYIQYKVGTINCNVIPFTFYPLITIADPVQSRLTMTFTCSRSESTNTVVLQKIIKNPVTLVDVVTPVTIDTPTVTSNQCILTMNRSFETLNVVNERRYRITLSNGLNSTSLDFLYVQPITFTNVAQTQGTPQIVWSGVNLTNAIYYIRRSNGNYPTSSFATNVASQSMGDLDTGTYILKATLGDLTAESEPFQYTSQMFLSKPVQTENTKTISWTGSSLANATYFIRFNSGAYPATSFASNVLTQSMDPLPSDTYVLKAQVGQNVVESEPFSYVIPPVLTRVSFSGSIASYTGTDLTGGTVDILEGSALRSNVVLNTANNTFSLPVPGGYYNLSFRMSHLVSYSNFSYYTVGSIDPTTAVVNTPIFLRGSNFSNISYVSFGNEKPSFVVTPTQLTTYVPNVNVTSANLTVYDIYGNNSSTYGFTYATLFNVSTFNPVTGVQRTPIVLKGSNFSNLETIQFGNTSTRTFSYSDTTIELTAPDSSETVTQVWVNDRYGNRFNYDTTYTYLKTTLIEYGAYSGASYTELYLDGNHLENTRYVKLGNASIKADYVNGQVQLIVPSGEGTVPIVAYDLYDNSSNSINLAGNYAPVYFTYTNMSAYSVNPPFGTKKWPLKIEGQFFNSDTRVYMGGTPVDKTINTEGTSMTFPAPPGIGNVSIQLKDAYGNESILGFEYRNPTVSRFNVSKGRTRLSLHIYGEHLNNTSYVLFGGVRHLDSIIDRTTYIEALVPETYGNVSVDVVDSYDNHTLAPGFFFCLGGNASISRVVPNRGKRNTSVTIFGENLEFTSLVQFGDSDASLNAVTPAFVNVSAPRGESTVEIQVTDIIEGDVYSYGSFTYENTSIFAMTPSQGPAGSSVKLEGTFLDTTRFLYVGNTSVACTSSLTEVTFVVPDGSTGIVYVVDDLDNVTYSPYSFVYQNPRISAITPSRGPPNVPITIDGIYLQNSSSLRINDTDLPLLTWDETTVKSTMPPGSDTVTLVLKDRYNNVTSIPFTYEYPTIVDATPSQGPPRQPIVLSGGYLRNTSYLTFGTTETRNFSVVDGSVEVIVPPGIGNVSITAYDIYKNPARYDTYEYQIPFARSLPSSNVSGSTVVMEGDFLANTSAVWFGPYPVTQFQYANGSLAIKVPPGTGNVSVTALDKYLNPATIESFDYVYPKIQTIIPDTGPQRQSIQITGDYLENTSAIYFGNTSASFQYANGSYRVTVPDGSGNVSVVAYDVYNNQAYGSYVYQNPVALSMNVSASVVGSEVFLSGNYLSNTSFIRFGSYPVTHFQYANDSLSITVPRGEGNVSITAYDNYFNTATISSFDYLFHTIRTLNPSTGPQRQSIQVEGDYLENISELWFGNTSIEFTYANGSIQVTVPDGSGNVSVSVYDRYQNMAHRDYTYRNPLLQSIDVSASVIGFDLLLTGLYLENTSIIDFGPYPVTDFTYANGSLRATVPPGTGNVSITVYDRYQNATSIDPFTYLFPVMDTLNPSMGPQRQFIQILGDHLENTSILYFGNTSTTFSYANGSLLAKVPDGSGNVSVIAYDRYQNPAYNTYLYQNPFARSIDVSYGVSGSYITLYGDHLNNLSTLWFGPYPVTQFEFIEEPTTLLLKVPPGKGNVSITVYDSYQNATSISSFDFVYPTLYSITPSSGPPNQYVTLVGDYLENSYYSKFKEQVTDPVYANGSVRMKVPIWNPEETVPANYEVAVTLFDYYDNPVNISYTYLNPVQTTLEFQGATQRWPITLRGFNLENTSKVHFNESYLDPASVSNDAVTLILPPGDISVPVSLIDTFGNETVPQEFVYRNPVIQRLSNLSGRTNLYMKVYGQNLEYTTQVLFGESPQLGTLQDNVFNSSLFVVVPEVTGPVPVRAIDACGNETTYLSFFGMGGNASVSKLDPNYGPTGINISVLGENLGFTKDVTFGGKYAGILYPITSSYVRVTIPPNQVTEVNTLVYDILDESVMYYGTFYYKNPSLNTSYAVGTTSTPVVLQGINLSGTVQAEFEFYQNETKINVSVPFIATDTQVSVRAIPGSGTSILYVRDAYRNVVSIPFTYQNPSVTVYPRFGPTGSTLNFSGEYLSNTSLVYFNDSSYLVGNDISIKVPPGNASVLLRLEDLYGNQLQAGVFTYQNPTLDTLTPNKGVRNTYLNLSGQFLQNLSYVQFGTERVLADGLRLQIPRGLNTVPVYAVDIYDNSTNPIDFTYVTPEITSLEPPFSAQRSFLNISGKYLYNISYVRLGQRLYDFTYTDTGVRVKVPDGSGNVSVYLEDLFENIYESPQPFTYANPYVSSINPSRGPANQPITLLGDHLQNTSSVQWIKRSEPNVSVYTTVLSFDASSIEIKSPEMNGIVDILVKDRYGNESQSISYEYQNPFIISVTRLEGGLMDQTTITGGFLQNTSFVRLGKRTVDFVPGDSLDVTINNGRGSVEISIEDRFGNTTIYPYPFTYSYTAVPPTEIEPYYGKPGNAIRAYLPDPLYALGDCSYVLFGIAQIPIFYPTYVEVRVPKEGTLIQLMDASGEALATNYSFEYETIPVTRLYPVEGFPGETVLIEGEFTETTQVYFNQLRQESLDPTYLGKVQYIHRRALLVTIPDVEWIGPLTLIDRGIGFLDRSLGSSVPFLVKHPRIDSVEFLDRLLVKGQYLSDIVSIVFGSEKIEFTITDTQLTGILPKGYGSVDVIAIPRQGNPLSLGLYTFPEQVEIPKPLRTGPVRCLAVDKILYFTNDRRIETQKETLYIHDRTITSLAVDTVLYFCDDRPKIHRYNPLNRRLLPPYGLPSTAESIRIHRNILYALLTIDPTSDTSSLWTMDLATHLQFTYLLEPTQGFALEGEFLYRTHPNGMITRSNLTVDSTEVLLDGLTNPKEIAVKGNDLFVSGSILHYRLDTLEQLSRYETEDVYVSFAWQGDTLYLANTTQSQIETIALSSPIFRLDTMTSYGTENSLFELTGEGLDRISEILFDHDPIREFQVGTSKRIVGKVPKGIGTPTVEILDLTYQRIPHRFTFTYRNTQVYHASPNQGYEHSPITLYGQHLDQVIRVYMGGVPVEISPIDSTRILIPHPQSGEIVLVDEAFNLIPSSSFTLLRLEAAICFREGTLIHTDQGPVEIQKLLPGHTVYGKEIKGITETYYTFSELVCVEAHSIRPDYPYRDTFMSKNHKIWLYGRMVEAQTLVGHPGIQWVPYTNEKLYNVLLEEEGRMNVQGMICETLDPVNPIASRFRWAVP